MHRLPGIVAGLATLTTTTVIAAAPAYADDPGPLPLPAVSIDLLPDRGSTTAAAEADPATTQPTPRPTGATTITTPARRTAVRTTNGGSADADAERQPITTRSSAPPPRATLGPAAPPSEPAAAGAGGNTDLYDRWFDLATLGIVALALLAVATIGRRRSGRRRSRDSVGGQARTAAALAHRPRRAARLRCDDGGFAERFLEDRRRSRHMGDT